MIDLHAMLVGDAVQAAQPCYALIVAYQDVTLHDELKFGAIALNKLPMNIHVSDAELCSLPEDSPLWPDITLSCISHEGKTVPIIDPERLFSSYHDRPPRLQQNAEMPDQIGIACN